MGDAYIVPGAGVAIFERKKRNVARCVTPQPRGGRKFPVVLLKVRVLVDRSDRRFLRRHIMHREFPSLPPHYSLGRAVRPANSEVTKRGALEDQRVARGVNEMQRPRPF